MKYLSIIALFVSLTGVGANAMAVEHSYAFDLSYEENFWFDNHHRYSKWSTPVESVVNIEKDRSWIALDSRIFVHSVCGFNSGGGFPQKMEMVLGGTYDIKLKDDPFSRARDRQMFVRVESLDIATGKMTIVAACTWSYAGGGGGSLGITGTATPK